MDSISNRESQSLFDCNSTSSIHNNSADICSFWTLTSTHDYCCCWKSEQQRGSLNVECQKVLNTPQEQNQNSKPVDNGDMTETCSSKFTDEIWKQGTI
ncbi:hypothetical protein L1887_00902 [Cichorium endivia]|nr:hypothetical protein L1887_00902 [Cichorium endivia]